MDKLPLNVKMNDILKVSSAHANDVAWCYFHNFLPGFDDQGHRF